MLAPLPIAFMKLIGNTAEALGVSTHFIQGKQPVVWIASGIFQSLGLDRPGVLLEAHGKLQPLRIFFFRLGPPSGARQEYLADEIENQRLHHRIALTGTGQSQINHLPIAFAGWAIRQPVLPEEKADMRRDIGAIDRKT